MKIFICFVSLVLFITFSVQGCGVSSRGTAIGRPVTGKVDIVETGSPASDIELLFEVFDTEGALVEVQEATTNTSGEYQIEVATNQANRIEVSVLDEESEGAAVVSDLLGFEELRLDLSLNLTDNSLELGEIEIIRGEGSSVPVADNSPASNPEVVITATPTSSPTLTPTSTSTPVESSPPNRNRTTPTPTTIVSEPALPEPTVDVPVFVPVPTEVPLSPPTSTPEPEINSSIPVRNGLIAFYDFEQVNGGVVCWRITWGKSWKTR